MAFVQHLKLESEAHVGALVPVRLPHDVVGAPDVVGQVEGHSLCHVRRRQRIGERVRHPRAHQSTVQRPAQTQFQLRNQAKRERISEDGASADGERAALQV